MPAAAFLLSIPPPHFSEPMTNIYQLQAKLFHVSLSPSTVTGQSINMSLGQCALGHHTGDILAINPVQFVKDQMKKRKKNLKKVAFYPVCQVGMHL